MLFVNKRIHSMLESEKKNKKLYVNKFVNKLVIGSLSAKHLFPRGRICVFVCVWGAGGGSESSTWYRPATGIL